MNRTAFIALFLIGSIAISGCAAADLNLWQLLNNRLTVFPPFKTLVSLLDSYGLRPLFDNSDPTSTKLTLFAPTDDAFAKVNLSGLSKQQVLAILGFHVISGASILSSDIEDGFTYVDPNGDFKIFSIFSKGASFQYSINDQANILLPSSNQAALNGVLHTIDSVLLIPSGVNNMSILDSVRGNPNFTILTKALIATGRYALLRGYQATVFAPTDAAFNALPPSLAEALFADVNLLTAVVDNHIMSNEIVFSSALSDGEEFSNNLESSKLLVSVNSNGVFINNAQVTQPDLLRSNGVIHVVDRVLLPN